jgi:hypothetical protein
MAWVNNPVASGDMFKQGHRVPLAPGEQLANRRGSQVQWMTPPPFDMDSVKLADAERLLMDRYYGLPNKEVPEMLQRLYSQDLVDCWLISFGPVMAQTVELYRQFYSDEAVAGITGVAEFSWDSVGAADVSASFDAANTNPAWVKEKIAMISEFVLPMDNAGIVPRGELVKIVFSSIFPQLKNLVLPESDAAQKEQKEERAALAQILVGMEPDFVPGGNHKLRLEVLSAEVQRSPAMRKKLQEDETIASLLQARADAHRQQLAQAENAVTGRTGYQSPLEE